MRKRVKTTGWAILHHGEIWPWTGGIVYRTRKGTIDNWIKDSGVSWKWWHRHGTRAVRVVVTLDRTGGTDNG